MNSGECESKISELKSTFLDDSHKEIVSNLLGDLTFGYNSNTHKWEVYTAKEGSGFSKLCDFDVEYVFWDWIYEEYERRFFFRIRSTEAFVSAQNSWIISLLVNDKSEYRIFNYLRRECNYNFDYIKTVYSRKEIEFAEYFDFNQHIDSFGLVMVLFDWFEKDGSDFVNEFETSLIQLFNGSIRDFFCGFLALNNYIVLRNTAKKQGKYFFDIDIIRVMSCFKSSYKSKISDFDGSLLVELADETSVDVKKMIENFDKSNIKYCGFSLLDCNDSTSLFV